jgi:hypothetical protein
MAKSYYLGIKKSIQTFKSSVTSLVSSMQRLHLMLARFAQITSLYGNLNKAPEGLAKS